MKTLRFREEKLGQGYSTSKWLGWDSDAGLFTMLPPEAKEMKP